MAYRDSPFQEIKVPLTWTAAAATVVALGLAVLVFSNDRKDQAKGHVQALGHTQVRAGFDTVMAPISGVLAAPMRWIGDGASSIGDYFDAVSENRKLKKQIADLRQMEIDNAMLRNANRRYEELLKLRTEPPIPMVTGRVVADTRGPFSNARLIDVGANSGVKIGNPAMTDQGVVGRVVGVAGNASRLLLLTDPESRTPVLVDRTNARAVLTGDGGANPRLDYLRGKDVVKNGDLVLTSGDGGLYPRGLPVGVAQQDIRGVWRVRLLSDRGSIDFVKVLVYDDFSQVVDQARLTATAMPPLPGAQEAQVKAAAAKPATTAPSPGSAPASAVKPGAPAPPSKVAAPLSSAASPPGRTGVATARPTATKTAPSPVRKPAKLAPGQYRRVHTPDVPPIMDERGLPQYDPSRPQGRAGG